MDDLEWQLEKPAVTLGKYYKDVKTFAQKNDDNKKWRAELDSKENESDLKKKELSAAREELQAMGASYVSGDAALMIQNVQDDAAGRIRNEQSRLEADKKELLEKKEKDISENDAWLDKRIREVFGDSAGEVRQELTEIEKKALEYEIERREFIVASNEKINRFQDGITQEDLECKTVVGQWKQDEDAIYGEFEPDIIKYKKVIESINRKYQPDIRHYQSVVSEKVAMRDEEIGQLQLERDGEVQLANNEIDAYQRDYKKTDRQYSEQIRMAKLQNKPTTRMENNRVSRLNAINDQIQKVNIRTNKKIAGIDRKIEVASSKHEKQIQKAEAQLELVIRNRDSELSSPTQILNGLIKDRDGQISAIKAKIDQREKECLCKIESMHVSVNNEQRLQSQHNEEIDQRIIQYVMSGETCYSDVLDETNAPFLALQNKIDSWMESLSEIKKKKMSSAYIAVHEKQKRLLTLKTYGELQKELEEAEQYNNLISVFARKNNTFIITGGVLTALGVIAFIILNVILEQSAGIIGAFVAVLGIVLTVITVMKTNKEFSLICKYVSLAADYQEFPAISAYSSDVTKERELAKMKNMGNKLYDIHYGRAEAQKIHDAKAQDIQLDYDRNLKLLIKEFENLKAQIEREREAAIKKIESDASDGEKKFYSQKEKIQSIIQDLIIKIDSIDKRIRELKDLISENQKFISAFEENYQQLKKKLQDINWWTPMEYTHGKLQDDLYIIPENDSVDNYGHKKIYRINHNKKAFVVTYDISDLGIGDGSHTEKIGNIIRNLLEELMYSVYRMNSRGTYAQFIVDEVVCTNDFKSTKYKNAFNIVDVVGRVEDIRGRLKGFAAQGEKLAEKGTKMDDVNESKFRTQDRPEVYNILYVVYRPEERKSKLDEEIRTLIPGCEKYGFLPVFVCEKETWDREIQENESMYKEIKNLVNNPVVIYDGKIYFIKEKEYGREYSY